MGPLAIPAEDGHLPPPVPVIQRPFQEGAALEVLTAEDSRSALSAGVVRVVPPVAAAPAAFRAEAEPVAVVAAADAGDSRGFVMMPCSGRETGKPDLSS